MNRIPVAVVVGPTATGKSRLAAALALAFDGEVVSADSMQVYRGIPVGTAQPTETEMRGVPHHLIGFLPLSETFSAADYTALAAASIEKIRERGRLPVLAGGTGLYVSSLLRGVRFPCGGGDGTLRAELFRRAEAEGPEALWKELHGLDPEAAEKIHPNNIGRTVRAIEICQTTGVTMTEQLRRSREKTSPYDACVIGLDYRDRRKLYESIGRRVDTMMERGLLDEARRVLSPGSATTAAQAIGYKEFGPYFRGECGLSEAVEQVKRGTRRYAKRQRTWFRHQENAAWIYLDDVPDFEGALRLACEILREREWAR